MFLSRVAMAAGLASALLIPMVSAQAQNANRPFGNTTVPGVCMLSQSAVITNSKVGKAANARMQQLATQANRDLETKRKALESSLKQYEDKAASLSDAQRQSQEQSLQQRMQSFDQQSHETSLRLQATRDQATETIIKTLDPLVADIYKQRKCGILIDRDAVLGGNYGNDLTTPALAALDKKMSTISFNMAPLPKQ